MASKIGFLLFALVMMPRSAVAEDFGAWSLLCDSKGENCSISQVIATDPQARNVLMGITLSYNYSADRLSLDIRTGPTADVIAGVGMKIDNEPPRRFPMAKCDTGKCVASVWVDDAFLKELKSGTTATVAYLIKPNGQMSLPVSFDGFTDALDALDALLSSR